MSKIWVISEKCSGCKRCIKACPFSAVEVIEKKAIIGDKCNLCGACIDVCKEGAIVIEKKGKELDISGYKGVWVFGEQREGKFLPVVYELLGEGRKLADKLKEELSVIVMGDKFSDKPEDLIFYGADKVYLASHELLSQYRAGPYAKAMTDLINEYKPEIVLVGATTMGRSLAPRVAARIKCGLTADCTGLEIDEQKKILRQTRPAFGGNIMATIISPDYRPQMATVRPKVMKRALRQDSRTGQTVKVTPKLSLEDAMVDIIKVMKVEENVVDLQESEIIVSGGRGIGKAENFSLIKELAGALGGAVGASRATVDAGWIPSFHQVGQTGKQSAPNYI